MQCYLLVQRSQAHLLPPSSNLRSREEVTCVFCASVPSTWHNPATLGNQLKLQMAIAPNVLTVPSYRPVPQPGNSVSFARMAFSLFRVC